MTDNPLRTRLTDELHIEVPVIGAPMAGAAGGRLAAAVSGAGALGMIGVGAAMTPEAISAQARIARAAGHPFGIGLMAWALGGNPQQLDAAIEAGPALVSVSFGDYAQHVARLHDKGIVVATQVGDVPGAIAAADRGVDVIVARGAEAGGHGLNRVATLPLLQGVLDELEGRRASGGGPIVVAAGGITTGRGLAAALAAGADGAWVGTALLACPEAENNATARARICAASGESTVYTSVFDIAQHIDWPAPYGGRALANAFTDRWHGHEEELAADPDARGVMAAAKEAADYDTAYLYAGQGVGSVTRERPTADVINNLSETARAHLARAAAPGPRD